jgi:hypothetical protein
VFAFAGLFPNPQLAAKISFASAYRLSDVLGMATSVMNKLASSVMNSFGQLIHLLIHHTPLDTPLENPSLLSVKSDSVFE